MEASTSQNNTATEDTSSGYLQVIKICEALKQTTKVNVYGPSGVGKTWVTKRVSDRATRVIDPDTKKPLCDLAIWVFMCKDNTKDSLFVSIARQLCLLPSTEEWEDEDDNKEQNKAHTLEKPISIQTKIHKKLENKMILLILDDFPDHKTENKPDETKFWSVWGEMFPGKDVKKIFVSRIRRVDDEISDENAFKIKALTRVKSVSLLREKLNTRLRRSDRIQALGEKFIDKSSALTPRTVTMIAKVLNYFGTDASGVSMLEKELEETSEPNDSVNKFLCHIHGALPIEVLKDLWWRGQHFFRDSGSVHHNEVITFWILEGYLGVGSMTELYKKGHDVLMDLMDCGVLKAQEDGYVFMDNSVINVNDLYQCVDQIATLGLATVFTSNEDGFGRITHQDGMLKTPRTRKKRKNQEVGGQDRKKEGTQQEGGQDGKKGKSQEEGGQDRKGGEAREEGGQDRKKGKTQEENGQDLSTLLLDGTHFSEQVMTDFLELEKNLEVLALFNPTIKSLPKPLDKMNHLRVLVLRGCEFLQDFKLHLHALQVLEISGARFLKSIKSEFFKSMVKLQSLNLSGLQITSLPKAIYSLFELRWLVIKDCHRLKKLESLAKLVHLTVIDLSGNIALETVDKNFLKFSKLQSLNLSKTKVPTTPLLKNIGELTHLLCRDCESLGRLRGLTSLTSLQTIDLSGSADFEEFHDSSLESLSSLRTLNLSGTKLDRLPSNISNPCYLYLKSCLHLERLSCIESIVDLEVLDVSGSKNLNEIEDEFFNHMTRLRVLNLSETKVKSLPSFSKLSNLRELFLSRCSSLTKLPPLESAKKLEVLDASECSALKDIGNQSFEGMIHLQKLDFSQTKIESFPFLSTPSNLRQLSLNNCTALQNLDKLNVSLLNLEELNLSGIISLKHGADFVKDSSNLRILNLSHTPLEQLPSMSKLTNLTHLSLAGCSCLKTELDLGAFRKLQVLDLSRSSIKSLRNLNKCKNLQKLLLEDCSNLKGFPNDEVYRLLQPNLKIPNGISGLSHLSYVIFPNIKDIKQEANHYEWNICQISNINKPPIFLSGTQFLTLFPTNKNDDLSQGPFHLCAIPAKADGETGDRYFQRHELVFGDVYLHARRFSQYKGNCSLQIRGFEQFPKGMETVISRAKLVFLIDNKFESLPSSFDASMLNELKGCWIERCDKMVTIFNDVEENLKIPLENLAVSNNCGLKIIHKGKQAFESFDSLKSLYLDHCPNLSTVFPSTWLPKNLQVLQIKYCDKLASLFETGGELPKLETLHLWELPALENVDFSFPSLQTLRIRECPKVIQVENFEIAKGLKTLWIAGATTLKSLNTKHESVELETLKLESCPILEHVMSSCLPLGNIKMIEVRSCEKLRTLFTLDYGFLNLNTLCLEDLPLLEDIGRRFPSPAEKRTFECPNLKLEGTTYD